MKFHCCHNHYSTWSEFLFKVFKNYKRLTDTEFKIFHFAWNESSCKHPLTFIMIWSSSNIRPSLLLKMWDNLFWNSYLKMWWRHKLWDISSVSLILIFDTLLNNSLNFSNGRQGKKVGKEEITKIWRTKMSRAKRWFLVKWKAFFIFWHIFDYFPLVKYEKRGQELQPFE